MNRIKRQREDFAWLDSTACWVVPAKGGVQSTLTFFRTLTMYGKWIIATWLSIAPVLVFAEVQKPPKEEKDLPAAWLETTRHEVKIGNQVVKYTANAGTMLIKATTPMKFLT